MNNEKDIFSKLVEKAKTTSLSEREKTTLFSAVDSFVKKNPIFVATTDTVPASPIKSPFMAGNFQSVISLFHIHSLRAAAVVIMFFVVVGAGGTSFAAQNSLPGDILYPIMVNINEGVKSALLSGTAQIEYEVKRAKNRVEEAKKLVVEDRLSPEIKDQISVRLSSHVFKVQKEVENLAKSGKSGDLKTAFVISNDLETSLETDGVIKDILSEPHKASVISKENAENQILAVKTDDDVKVIAEAKLESAKRALQSVEGKIVTGEISLMTVSAPASVTAPTADSIQPVDTKSAKTSTVAGEIEVVTVVDPLIHARELIRLGEEKLKNQQYTEAFALFKEAYGLVQDQNIPDEVKINLKSESESTSQSELAEKENKEKEASVKNPTDNQKAEVRSIDLPTKTVKPRN